MTDPIGTFTSTFGAKSVEEMERQLQAIKKLEVSEGWQLLSHLLKQERDIAIDHLVDPHASERNIEFYRSSLRAIDKMLTLPSLVVKYLTADAALAPAKTTKETK